MEGNANTFGRFVCFLLRYTKEVMEDGGDDGAPELTDTALLYLDT